ncbi:hypothetical protein cyc_04772 [Cyclospora cayetanensis]|uniref:Uncharacterized protein n=1 Tax=Cyclospora cayetanensis TaxID=88456 RepID=A0A1D3CVV7_9EIME|nr:hypothetical protein cyc_04772 [Cyclospora cayetanensis]
MEALRMTVALRITHPSAFAMAHHGEVSLRLRTWEVTLQNAMRKIEQATSAEGSAGPLSNSPKSNRIAEVQLSFLRAFKAMRTGALSFRNAVAEANKELTRLETLEQLQALGSKALQEAIAGVPMARLRSPGSGGTLVKEWNHTYLPPVAVLIKEAAKHEHYTRALTKLEDFIESILQQEVLQLFMEALETADARRHACQGDEVAVSELSWAQLTAFNEQCYPISSILLQYGDLEERQPRGNGIPTRLHAWGPPMEQPGIWQREKVLIVGKDADIIREGRHEKAKVTGGLTSMLESQTLDIRVVPQHAEARKLEQTRGEQGETGGKAKSLTKAEDGEIERASKTSAISMQEGAHGSAENTKDTHRDKRKRDAKTTDILMGPLKETARGPLSGTPCDSEEVNKGDGDEEARAYERTVGNTLVGT